MADQDQAPTNQVSEDDYNFAHSMELGGVPVSGGSSPYEKYLELNPQFAHVPKERILGEMHKVMAPDLEFDRFYTLAQAPSGYDAIQKAKANLTDVEKFRVQFPQFKDVPRERILDSMYKKAVADKKVDPSLINKDEYRHQVDPLPGPMNDLWNLWEGIKTSSSAEFHNTESMLVGGYMQWMGKEFAKLMDSTSIGIDPESGKVTVGQHKPGTQLQELSTSLHSQVDKWVQTNMPGYFQVLQKFNEILTATGLTDAEQDKRARVDEARNAQWKDPWSQVGSVLGQTGTGLALNFPVAGALQKGFEAESVVSKLAPLSPEVQADAIRKKAAAILATTYLSTSKYKEAVEAHHENALTEGVLGAFSAASLGVLYNTGYGRILTGLNQAIIDAGPDQLEDLVSGQPTDYSKRAAQIGLDMSIGILLTGRVKRGIDNTRITLDFETHQPVSASDLLGSEDIGYPNKVSARSPLRVIGKTERTVTPDFDEESLLQQPTPEAPDVLVRGRQLTRQIPVQGEQGTRLVTNRVALAMPDALSNLEGVQETLETPNVLGTTERATKRVIGVRANLESQRGGLSPEVWEEVVKAVDARDKGDLPKAQAHHDMAVSLMSNEEAQTHAEAFVEAAKGESKVWTPVPKSDSDEEPEEWTAFDESMGIKPRRITSRGEMGSVINPAELILAAGKKVHELYEDYFKPWSLEKMQAAAIIRRVDIEAKSDEFIRDRLRVHNAISPWSSQSITRHNRWNFFGNDELKNILIQNRAGTRPVVSDPKKQSLVDYILHRYGQALHAAESAMTQFRVEPKDWYVRSMVKDGKLAEFDRWKQNWEANHGGASPTFEDALRAKIDFKSYNPEDWFQAQLNVARNLLERENAFQTFRGTARAIPVKEVDEPFRNVLKSHGWTVQGSPSGTKFYVEPETWAVMSRYFDEKSIYDVPVLKSVAKVARNLKSVTGNILSMSLVHPKHVWEISTANAFTQMGKGVPADQAWRAMTPNPPSDRVVAYMRQQISRDSLTPEDEWWYDKFKKAGMAMGINSERQTQMEFGRNIAEFLQKGHGLLHGADRTLTFLGANVLQQHWMQNAIFGHWIPLMKAQGFRLAVQRLIGDHPELLQDHNEIEFNRRLAEIGNNIDNRFGERNMTNLLWPRAAKEIGIAMTLSMGWTLGFFNVTGGAVKDYATSVTRMGEIFRDVNDPQRRAVVTERMKFFNNYAAAYLLSGAVMSLLYGWSKGKPFDPKDMVYPVVGEDNNYPPNDPHHWTRSRPVEFQQELLTLYDHINQAGGLAPSGALYGTESFAQNKLNPGIKSLWDAFVLQHDFFGQDLGGRPLEDEWQRWSDKIGYILFNNNTPITIKQQIESRAGHPAPKTFQEYLANVASPDIIPAILGYPRAPEHVYRSSFENAVVNAYSYGRNRIRSQQMVEKSNWENEYRLAVQNKNQKRADEVLDTLEKKYNVKPSVVKQMTKEGLRGESAAMYMFFHGDFTPEEQKKLLQKATPEEKKDWLSRATKTERQVLATLGVQ